MINYCDKNKHGWKIKVYGYNGYGGAYSILYFETLEGLKRVFPNMVTKAEFTLIPLYKHYNK